MWFTGLPGAGKITIASALELRLLEQGRGAYLLDGIACDAGSAPVVDPEWAGFLRMMERPL